MQADIPTQSKEAQHLAQGQNNDAEIKTQVGQFFTPSSIAMFMARLFPKTNVKSCKLLGAGMGIDTFPHVSSRFFKSVGAAILPRF